jgi:hypothetical protein
MLTLDSPSVLLVANSEKFIIDHVANSEKFIIHHVLRATASKDERWLVYGENYFPILEYWGYCFESNSCHILDFLFLMNSCFRHAYRTYLQMYRVRQRNLTYLRWH